MSTFHAITGPRLIKVLKKFGFIKIRQRGNHNFLQHPDGRCTVVPVHRGETIGRGLFAQILRDCELTRKDIEDEI